MECNNKCKECMKDAPYKFCCKLECGNMNFVNYVNITVEINFLTGFTKKI